MTLATLSDDAPPPPLGADDVDVWTVALEPMRAMRDQIEHAQALLDRDEQARFARVAPQRRREQLTLARAVLRVILAAYTATNPADLQLDTVAVGKPRLRGGDGPQFNLSHAGGVVAVAVTSRSAVGIDIEDVGRRVAPALLRRVLTPAELALVLSRPAGQRDEAFLRHWTAKEAYVKATGTGLSGDLRSVEIGDALGSPYLHGAPGAAFTLCGLDPRPGFVGAVAAAGGPFSLRRLRPPAAWRDSADSGGL